MSSLCVIFAGWWRIEWCPISQVKISTITPCGSLLRDHFPVKSTPKLAVGPRGENWDWPLLSICPSLLSLHPLQPPPHFLMVSTTVQGNVPGCQRRGRPQLAPHDVARLRNYQSKAERTRSFVAATVARCGSVHWLLCIVCSDVMRRQRYTIRAASKLTHQSPCLPVLVCSLSVSPVWLCLPPTALAVSLPAHKETDEPGRPLTLSVFFLSSPPLGKGFIEFLDLYW